MTGLTLESRALLRMTERALQAETHLAEARAALVAMRAERDAAIDVAASATRRADAAELGLDHALTAGELGLVAELDAARAEVAALTQALETAQARIDELTARAEKGGAS